MSEFEIKGLGMWQSACLPRTRKHPVLPKTKTKKTWKKEGKKIELKKESFPHSLLQEKSIHEINFLKSWDERLPGHRQIQQNMWFCDKHAMTNF